MNFIVFSSKSHDKGVLSTKVPARAPRSYMLRVKKYPLVMRITLGENLSILT